MVPYNQISKTFYKLYMLTTGFAASGAEICGYMGIEIQFASIDSRCD